MRDRHSLRIDFDEVLSKLKEIHPDIRLISTKIVIVGEWVRWKCRYGCRAYGKHLCCPPYAPSPEETRRMLEDYDFAVLARFSPTPTPGYEPRRLHHYLWDSLTALHKTIFELERQAFLMGCYKAFGMGAMPCTFCETCIAEEKIARGEAPAPMDAVLCRHKEMMRPSLEACGIDVFATLRNAGCDLSVLRSYQERFSLFGMVLLD
ncbi:DUF2284 domain-containing protein [Methanothrix sp.]|uniref:DUF2284 domain-containing protein n=1 Tax=Methanothrix sp. TaxID=90426 RepID=UPI002CE8A2D0|nr:DUF2284 domain-containing protein [Methanothrix sp.]HOK57872.1 DUF2284 domain-containing protein [Methanothrix sp.]HOL43275.1 DUF2284 domain-containing protein [Methanothrix sp.]HPO88187.1 DUF2284 domain-containing protein [Methanothrix sp.]